MGGEGLSLLRPGLGREHLPRDAAYLQVLPEEDPHWRNREIAHLNSLCTLVDMTQLTWKGRTGLLMSAACSTAFISSARSSSFSSRKAPADKGTDHDNNSNSITSSTHSNSSKLIVIITTVTLGDVSH